MPEALDTIGETTLLEQSAQPGHLAQVLMAGRETVGSVLQDTSDFLRHNALRIGATAIAAIGGAGADVYTGRAAASNIFPKVMHRQSSLTPQSVFNYIQKEAIIKNKWLGNVRPVKAAWGRPISASMVPNSAKYATSCKDQGIYWHYEFTGGGTGYNRCGESFGNILAPIGKASPEEFRPNIDSLGRDAKTDTEGLAQSENQVVRSVIGTTKEQGHLQETTVTYQCDPYTSELEYKTISLQQRNRLVGHTIEYLPVEATITTC